MNRPLKPRTRSFLRAPDRAGGERRQRSQPCPHHPDETLKFFCTSHQASICCICAIKYHKLCSDTLTYPETIGKFDKDRNAILKSLDRSNDSINELVTRKQELLGSLRAETNKVREELEAVCHKLHEAINDKKEDVILRINQMHEELIQENVTEIKTLNQLQDTSTQAKESLEKTLDRKWPIGMMSSLTSAQSNLADIERAITEVQDCKVRLIEFETSPQVHEFLTHTPPLGFLSFGEQSSAQDGDVIANGTETTQRKNYDTIKVPIIERMYEDNNSSSGEDISIDEDDASDLESDVFLEIEELPNDMNELPCQTSFIRQGGNAFVGGDSSGGRQFSDMEDSDPEVEVRSISDITGTDIMQYLPGNEFLLLQNEIIETETNTSESTVSSHMFFNVGCKPNKYNENNGVELSSRKNIDETDRMLKESNVVTTVVKVPFVDQNNDCENNEFTDSRSNVGTFLEQVKEKVSTKCIKRDCTSACRPLSDCMSNERDNTPSDDSSYSILDTDIVITGSEKPVDLQVKTDENQTDYRKLVESEAVGTQRYQTLITEFNTAVHSSECWIYGLAFLADGRLVLTDVAHDSIQLFDTEQNLTVEVTSQFTPWGISATSSDVIAVCAGSKGCVYLYSVKNNSIEQLKMIRIGVDCINVSTWRNDLVVGTRKGVIVMTEGGAIQVKFERNKVTGEEFRRSDFVTVLEDSLVISNSWSGKVTCLSEDGNQKWTMIKDGSNPRGLCCSDGLLIVADKTRNSLSINGHDGHTVGLIPVKTVAHPYALAHHPNLQIIAVSQWDEKLVIHKTREVKLVQYW